MQIEQFYFFHESLFAVQGYQNLLFYTFVTTIET